MNTNTENTDWAVSEHLLITILFYFLLNQVLEPQNVDPSMVQMTFLDDVVHSLLKGENIGITSRRRSRSNQNSNTVHVDTFIFLPKYFCVLQILKIHVKSC